MKYNCILHYIEIATFGIFLKVCATASNINEMEHSIYIHDIESSDTELSNIGHTSHKKKSNCDKNNKLSIKKARIDMDSSTSSNFEHKTSFMNTSDDDNQVYSGKILSESTNDNITDEFDNIFTNISENTQSNVEIMDDELELEHNFYAIFISSLEKNIIPSDKIEEYIFFMENLIYPKQLIKSITFVEKSIQKIDKILNLQKEMLEGLYLKESHKKDQKLDLNYKLKNESFPFIEISLFDLLFNILDRKIYERIEEIYNERYMNYGIVVEIYFELERYNFDNDNKCIEIFMRIPQKVIKFRIMFMIFNKLFYEKIGLSLNLPKKLS